mmetsp:Transcript_23880/g.65601  ORF Transcript_23880/g.65601 Transcript_23880/m.65601 type:complete len:103 (-) Transcript_23880:552-860(-)
MQGVIMNGLLVGLPIHCSQIYCTKLHHAHRAKAPTKPPDSGSTHQACRLQAHPKVRPIPYTYMPYTSFPALVLSLQTSRNIRQMYTGLANPARAPRCSLTAG